MIDPYGIPPGHNANPVQPVTLDIGDKPTTFCACDQCHEVRQRWTDNQIPAAELLDQRDTEDN